MRAFDDALPPVDGRRVALVIGNSDYAAEGWLDLANARNDATHIAQVLGDPARGHGGSALSATGRRRNGGWSARR